MWAIGYWGQQIIEWEKKHKKMNISILTQQQKEDTERKAIDKHHTSMFILGARKLIEDMKKDVFRKNDPFPNTNAEACHIISKWKEPPQQ